MIVCNTCKHFDDEFTNGCDILNQIQNIADTYRLELNIKISKCDAYGVKSRTLHPGDLMTQECSNCIHVSTPKGKSCYTMTRRLSEIVGNKPFIPVNVIPALDQIATTCSRCDILPLYKSGASCFVDILLNISTGLKSPQSRVHTLIL